MGQKAIIISIIFFATEILLISCSKKSFSTTNLPPPRLFNPSLQVNLNGITYNDWSASINRKINNDSISMSYWLFGIPGGAPVFQSYNPFISLRIKTNNLTTGTFTDGVNRPIAGGMGDSLVLISSVSNYWIWVNSDLGDFATFNITSIHDSGYVDGMFNARLTGISRYTNDSSKGETNLTGEFHNLKIY